MNKHVDPNEIIELRLLLRRTEEKIQNARREELQKYKITPETSALLHIIGNLGGSAKPVELSRWLSRKHHSVHELINRIEKAGLVEKVHEPGRKNGVRVFLTDEGKKLNSKTKQLKGPSRIFSSLSEEQRKELKKLLNILLDEALKQVGAKDEVILRRPNISDRTIS